MHYKVGEQTLWMSASQMSSQPNRCSHPLPLMFSVRYEKIKFLVIALKNAVEVYAWAPKPYHKFMAFKVGNVPMSSVYSRTVGVSAINTTIKHVLCFCHQQLKLLIVHAAQFLESNWHLIGSHQLLYVNSSKTRLQGHTVVLVPQTIGHLYGQMDNYNQSESRQCSGPAQFTSPPLGQFGAWCL